MTKALTDVSVFTADVYVTENSDPRTAESVEVSFQALANRTRHLRDNAVNGDGSNSYAGDLTWTGEHTYEGPVEIATSLGLDGAAVTGTFSLDGAAITGALSLDTAQITDDWEVHGTCEFSEASSVLRIASVAKLDLDGRTDRADRVANLPNADGDIDVSKDLYIAPVTLSDHRIYDVLATPAPTLGEVIEVWPGRLDVERGTLPPRGRGLDQHRGADRRRAIGAAVLGWVGLASALHHRWGARRRRVRPWASVAASVAALAGDVAARLEATSPPTRSRRSPRWWTTPTRQRSRPLPA